MGSQRELALRPVIDGLRRKYGSFPERLVDIPNFPFSDFASLRKAVSEGRVRVQRFSFEYGSAIFDLFAEPAERAYQTFTSFIGIAGPVVGIILAVTVRWWWLIPGLLTPILVMREKKKLYNAVIYRGALESELGFCFLYRVKQVSLASADYQSATYWTD